MSCTSPTYAWQSISVNENGRRKPVFRPSQGDKFLPMIPVPCGKCTMCLARKSMDWATRAFHESQMHKQSCCFTATYDNEHLPADGKLDAKHTRAFVRGIKQHFDPIPIRAFIVGEYGAKSGRAHLHGFFFGTDALGGSIRLSSINTGPSQYTNPVINKIWKRGHVQLDQVTPESCAYIAGYCLKKIDEQAKIMSYPRKPALGRAWFNEHLEQLVRLGHVVINGRQRPIPQIYYEWANGALDKWKDESMEFSIKMQEGFRPAELQQRADNRAQNLRSKGALKSKKI